MRTLEVADRAGLTPRQIQFWAEKGYVATREPYQTGIYMDFDGVEAQVIITAGKLVAVGIKAAEAVEYARLMVEEKTDSVSVGGVLITVMPAGAEETDGIE
jgi:DNA-binding transcriptional MerR regulator